MFFSNHRWIEFVIGVAVPTVLTAAAVTAVVFLAMGRVTEEVNSIDRAGVGRVVDVLKNETLTDIGLAATEFAAWDDADRALSGPVIDGDFVDANLRFPTESGRFFDRLLLLEADGSPLYAFREGKSVGPGDDGISRADIAAMIAAEMTSPHRPVTGFVQSRSGILAAGLHRVEPQQGTSTAPRPRYLLVGRPLDEGRMLCFVKALGVRNLSYGPVPLGEDGLPLVSPSGVHLGSVSWQSRQSGSEAMQRAQLPVIAVLSLLFILLGFLLFTIFKMMSALRRDESTARHAATHDALSGLPNRSYFNDRLRGACLDGRSEVAVLFADLDGFKEVNDTYGHDVGDRLIRAVAAGFRLLTGEGACLARLGGDEFAVVVEGQGASARALDIAQHFLAFLDEAFDFEGRTVRVGSSIGIAGDVGAMETPGELVRRADVAMYAAKAGGKNRVAVYDGAMDAERKAKAGIAAELREALINDGLQVHYQPVVSARTGRVSAVEALIRWIRPVSGPVAPSLFLAVAEEAGMTDLIGRYVLSKVARDARAFGDLKVVVNVFSAQVRDPGFADALKAILDAEGLSPDRLEIDIAEGFLVSEPERARRAIESLHALGVSVALDDFGTGFSSVAYLRRFAFDKVKIDRSVVIDAVRDPASRSLVEAAVALAETLGAEVTAEGIELAEEAEALKAAGCHELQGYFFGSPTVPSEILRRLEREDGRVASRRA